MRLLILDDNLRIATLVAALARAQGWEAETASTGSEFQALYLARVPDGIMLDLQLGNSDGVEQMRFLRASQFLGAMALMSGFDPHVLSSARELGQSFGLRITSVLEKPARAARVREVLKEIEAGVMSRAPDAAGEQSRAAIASAIGNIDPSEIASALARGEMALHLQPIVSAESGEVVQLEGLIRWHSPQYGTIPPSQFVPVAEQKDAVIDQLTFCVVQTALNHYLHLTREGFAVPIAVNVSGINLRSLDFPDRLAALVASANAPPSAIALEVTESVAMLGLDTIADVLTRLRLKGFALAIDDLGTGFSSLRALKQIPFSEIKIDKSFIADVVQSKESYAIVTSIVDLARRMNLICVAEGVENHETAQLLSNLRIDRLQGDYYSPPMALEDLVKWLGERNTRVRSVASDRSSG